MVLWILLHRSQWHSQIGYDDFQYAQQLQSIASSDLPLFSLLANWKGGKNSSIGAIQEQHRSITQLINRPQLKPSRLECSQQPECSADCKSLCHRGRQKKKEKKKVPPPPTTYLPRSEPLTGHMCQCGPGRDTVCLAEMVSGTRSICFMSNWILSARVSCRLVAKLTLSLWLCIDHQPAHCGVGVSAAGWPQTPSPSRPQNW